MTNADIQYLKDNIDRLVQIKTIDGECLVARILFVTHDGEQNEHDILYQIVSSNMIDWYVQHRTSAGYVLDFERIVSFGPVAPIQT